MELCSDKPLLGTELRRYAPAAALLAVHAAIAMCDAILVLHGEERSTSHGHEEAVARLRQLCGRLGAGDRGIAVFERLVARRGNIAHDEQRLTSKEAEAIVVQAQRFTSWAYQAFPQMLVPEETHGS